VTALALIAALLVLSGVIRTGRATAGTTGASPGVFVTGSDSLDDIALDSLSGGGNLVGGGPFGQTTSAGPISINATATTALVGISVTSELGPTGYYVTAVNLTTQPPSVLGTSPLPGGPVEFAMDPTDPDNVYALVQNANDGSSIYQVTLGSGSPVVSGAALYSIAAPPETLVISPDGSTLYLGTGNADAELGAIVAIPVASPTKATVWRDARAGLVTDLAVAPTGTNIYGTLSGGAVVDVSLPLPTAGFVWNERATDVGITVASSIAISPDGSVLYVDGPDTNANRPIPDSVVDALDSQNGNETSQQHLATYTPGAGTMALSPDGSTLVVAGESLRLRAAYVFSLPAPGLTSVTDTEVSNAGLLDMSPHNLAITPDQAPVAALDPASGTAGQPVALNAGGSSVAYGSITTFAWNFGDGQTATTSGPQVDHVYASAGNYTVTVTETDSAGNSVPPAPGVSGDVNTSGETPYFYSNASASTTAPVAISRVGKPPPTVPTTLTHKSTTPTTAGHHPPGTPHLVLNPAVGPPGTIVTVTGNGFPKNTPITISWSVSSGSVVIMSDGNGNLPAHELFVLTPDVLGPRYAVASTTPSVKAPFLVVPSTSEPGGDEGSFLFRSEGP
jgi:hypothetical protein